MFSGSACVDKLSNAHDLDYRNYPSFVSAADPVGALAEFVSVGGWKTIREIHIDVTFWQPEKPGDAESS